MFLLESGKLDCVILQRLCTFFNVQYVKEILPVFRAPNAPSRSLSSSKSKQTPAPDVETPQPPDRQRDIGTTP